MFRCKRAPPEPVYEPDLEKLGFRLNEENQFVNIKDGSFFDYFHTDSDRVNDLRKEAFHTAARAKIYDVLSAKYGIQEVFIIGATLHTKRPSEPHVSILCNEVSELKRKRDIVVVIGESGEDPGIWAWRLAAKAEGIESGSAIGLAAKLAAFGKVQKEDDFKGEREELKVRKASTGKKEQDTAPGLIILNPGQLLYSHETNKNMTKISWDHRPRPNALSQEYNIDEKHNRVQSHEDPDRHIHTCLEHILQQIMPDGARIYFIMIGDGSTHGLCALDQVFMNKNSSEIRGGKVEAVAFIEPRHDADEITDQPDSPDGITSDKLKDFLARQGQSWVSSDTIPKGQKISIPMRGLPPIEYAPGTLFKDENVSNEVETVANRPDSKLDVDDKIDPPTDGTVRNALEDGELKSTAAAEKRVEEAFDAGDEKEKRKENGTDHPDGNDDNSGDQLPHSVRDLPPTKTPVAPKTKEEIEWLEEQQEGVYVPEPLPVSSVTVSAGQNETGALEVVFPAVEDEVLDFIFHHVERVRAWQAHPEMRPKTPQPRDCE